MKTNFSVKFLLLVASLFIWSNILSQEEDKENNDGNGYIFDTIVIVDSSPVKDQHRSGTCWAFASVSFLESEIIRQKGDVYDLSEMYVVRNTYPEKAKRYVRLHGNSNIGSGGQAHDLINVIRNYGMVPESVYPGLTIGEEKHNHGEMDAVQRAMLKAVVSNRGGKVTPVWFDAYKATLDVYLGQVPEKFDYNGKTYTPHSFAQSLGINPDDYIEITSFSHHPFYEKFTLLIPDNWTYDDYYNVPVDDLITIMKHALNSGYTVCWDGDVSEKEFTFKKGVATIPLKNWDDKDEKEKELTNKKPEPEVNVTQQMRQESYDNYTSTDDHLMHITGIVHDQNGTQYFITKNSWDDDSNDFGGFLEMSEQYVRLKTIAIMIHKDALPEEIKKKLNL